MLEELGVHVHYGGPWIKVHNKKESAADPYQNIIEIIVCPSSGATISLVDDYTEYSTLQHTSGIWKVVLHSGAMAIALKYGEEMDMRRYFAKLKKFLGVYDAADD